MIKVLILDPSAVVRQSLAEILDKDPQIQVVGTAPGPNIALEKIKRTKPNLIILNRDLPGMNSEEFIRILLGQVSFPVTIIISIPENDSALSAKARGTNTEETILIPRHQVRDQLHKKTSEIINKVKQGSFPESIKMPVEPNTQKETGISQPKAALSIHEMVIAIGASTGGTEAIKDVICALPETIPPIVITQHIPMTFSKPFSERLDANAAMKVVQAEHGQKLESGYAYLAPGDHHLEVKREGDHYVCQLLNTAPVNRHKPSVEVMFQSIAKHVASNALAILLTGMGDDGAEAMGALQKTGARTIAQDESSSVVWGMPGEAVKKGFADEILPLDRIAERVLYYISKHR
ncbi:MAG: chemotaxis-specific protein-glutamate methyltransferase CheB [Gammaproteobacteria bacterium]|nr:chemotaxis-specific protein-glutamate methyltransferase CheB [Gammaproteobacteria bacterium]